ncbi:MAG: hypothetical protein ACREFX_12070 [Opitutaceae bacterium]
MSPPRSPSRLQKWPFLVADAAFLAAAGFVAGQSGRPLGFTSAVLVMACVAGAAICGVVPFLLEYARRQEEALDGRQRSLEALSQTVAASAEQLGIAASGLHEIAELAQKNLKLADQLPHRMKEEVKELEARLASAREDDREELERELAALRGSESERLESAAEKIALAAADWSKAESSAQRHTTSARSLLAEIDQRLAAFRSAGNAAAAPAGASKAAPVPSSAAPAVEPPTAAPPAANAHAGAPPSKPASNHTRRKPAPDELPASLVPGNPQPDASEEPQLSPEDSAPPSSISADGATRLLVRAYIGIGNRLFIRGDGPGLSWEEGVPLQFVSIGRWRWETADAARPIHFKIFRNDRDACASPADPPPLEPGRQQELTVSFKG